MFSREHGAGCYKYAGHIKPCRGHEQAWHVFVAGGEKDDSLEDAMGAHHVFNHVCDKLTGWQAVFHAVMSHCDSVADADYREFQRDASCLANAVFRGVGQLVQVDVTWNDFVKGVDHCD
ncbi:hypothetical protein BMS3Abin16_01241 [archaeon BMS3Abin16]|nr:hypothetical protein BMS3Abin16_01241 [archaeon BMS3Abin16]